MSDSNEKTTRIAEKSSASLSPKNELRNIVEWRMSNMGEVFISEENLVRRIFQIFNTWEKISGQHFKKNVGGLDCVILKVGIQSWRLVIRLADGPILTKRIEGLTDEVLFVGSKIVWELLPPKERLVFVQDFLTSSDLSASNKDLIELSRKDLFSNGVNFDKESYWNS